MLTHRNTSIVFGIVLITLLILDGQYSLSWVWYLIAASIYGGILFYGSYFIRSNFYFPVISGANTSEKIIAISFDDGPVVGKTASVLKTLREAGVPGCFFCIGKHVAAEPLLARQIFDEGHIIGNHSYGHAPLFDLYSSKKMTQELQQMNAAVRQATGETPRLFRPPYGVTNPMLRKAVNKTDMVTIGWNIRSLDTVAKDAKKLKARILSRLRPGAILLLHDHCEITLQILPDLLKEVREAGYEWVRLDKLLNLDPYA